MPKTANKKRKKERKTQWQSNAMDVSGILAEGSASWKDPVYCGDGMEFNTLGSCDSASVANCDRLQTETICILRPRRREARSCAAAICIFSI